MGEKERYARHLILEEIGEPGQEKLKRAKVLVVGAGGLGSPVLLYLTAAGIGRIGILDNDIVSESNLQRQILYDTQCLGALKVEVAARKLQALNPYTTIVPYAQRLTSENTFIIAEYDLVIDATDNLPSRYLIDEACAQIRTENDTKPAELDALDRKIIQMEVEEAALKKEEDELSKARLAELQKELAEKRDARNAMNAQLENEKTAIDRVNQLREKLVDLNCQVEAAKENGENEKAGKLLYKYIPDVEKQLEEEERRIQTTKEKNILSDRVTDREIAKIVERWTGIPVSRLVQGLDAVETSVNLYGFSMGIIVLCLTQSFAHGAALEQDVEGLV